MANFVEKTSFRRMRFFLVRPEGHSRGIRVLRPRGKAAWTSRLKTVHRTVFLTPLTLSGFESHRTEKESPNLTVRTLFFGPPGGTRTPILWNRNPLRYPISPRADGCEKYCTPSGRISQPLLRKLPHVFPRKAADCLTKRSKNGILADRLFQEKSRRVTRVWQAVRGFLLR